MTGGTEEMQDTHSNYKDYGEYSAFLRSLNCDNSAQHSRLKHNLIKALTEELTARQWEFVSMYYMQGMKMTQIAKISGVNISTVSHTLSRARRRLQRCLRYGAKQLLMSSDT